MAICTLLYQCFTTFQVSTLIKRDEFAPFLKGYIQLLRTQGCDSQSAHMSRQGHNNQQHLVDLCKLLMCAMYYTTRMNIVLIPVLAALRPTSPEYVSSLLTEPHGYLTRCASACLQMYIMTCYGQVMALWCGTIALFMFSMHHLIVLNM